ncbi:MAG: 4a-hydroxytetrahydrobiopterin dehydratase [Legionellales bacterium]|nr:4a-hydroxytetrahydrobiopterin dehydratase [Legionellales bacterium]|tara:strand:+ start:7056 stop:7397 length:342 start_codon:yes stop_codon:yes gene_type:complete
MTEQLTQKRCLPCEGGVPALDMDAATRMLEQVEEWDLKESGKEIVRSFHFKNYYETMAFVNAIAWMAHNENHHPDIELSYNHALVRYSTHAIGGLSENDFICAAKVDKIFRGE